MTQQEIFQNMTKGELSYTNFKPQDRFEVYSDSSRTVIAKINYNDATGKNIEHEANVEAICSAVNNTYGKGINPEGVEKIYNKALNLAHKISDNIFDADAKGVDAHIYLSDIRQELIDLKEALTAVKLTT